MPANKNLRISQIIKEAGTRRSNIARRQTNNFHASLLELRNQRSRRAASINSDRRTRLTPNNVDNAINSPRNTRTMLDHFNSRNTSVTDNDNRRRRPLRIHIDRKRQTPVGNRVNTTRRLPHRRRNQPLRVHRPLIQHRPTEITVRHRLPSMLHNIFSDRVPERRHTRPPSSRVVRVSRLKIRRPLEIRDPRVLATINRRPASINLASQIRGRVSPSSRHNNHLRRTTCRHSRQQRLLATIVDVSERFVNHTQVDRLAVTGRVRRREHVDTAATTKDDRLVPLRTMNPVHRLTQIRRHQNRHLIVKQLLTRIRTGLRRVRDTLRRIPRKRALNLERQCQRRLPRLTRNRHDDLAIRRPAISQQLGTYVSDEPLPRHQRLAQSLRHRRHACSEASPASRPGRRPSGLAKLRVLS